MSFITENSSCILTQAEAEQIVGDAAALTALTEKHVFHPHKKVSLGRIATGALLNWTPDGYRLTGDRESYQRTRTRLQNGDNCFMEKPDPAAVRREIVAARARKFMSLPAAQRRPQFEW